MKVTFPGSKVFEFAGEPPVKVQLYVMPVVSSVQLFIVAVGVKVTAPHALEIGLIFTVGGFFTSISVEVVSVPQPVVMLCVSVYVPGFLNKNLGFSEVSSVPFVNSQSADVPQLSAVYPTVHL